MLMPRYKLIRVRMPRNELLARSFAILMLNVLGAAITGATFAIAVVFGEEIRLIAADEESTSFSSIAVQAGAIGGSLGAMAGAVTSPIAVLAMIRTDFISPLVVTFLASSLAALTAVIHPAVGLLASLVAYLAACIVTLIRVPQTWPRPIPPGACVSCGYDLKGLDADHCPECGKQRPSPRQCRVCLNPIRRMEFLRPAIVPSPVLCGSCRQHIGPDLTCQRCGHHFPPDAANCPGCHRPTGLPSKT